MLMRLLSPITISPSLLAWCRACFPLMLKPQHLGRSSRYTIDCVPNVSSVRRSSRPCVVQYERLHNNKCKAIAVRCIRKVVSARSVA